MMEAKKSHVKFHQPFLYRRMRYNSQRKNEEKEREGRREADIENIRVIMDA